MVQPSSSGMCQSVKTRFIRFVVVMLFKLYSNYIETNFVSDVSVYYTCIIVYYHNLYSSLYLPRVQLFITTNSISTYVSLHRCHHQYTPCYWLFHRATWRHLLTLYNLSISKSFALLPEYTMLVLFFVLFFFNYCYHFSL